MVCHVGFKAGTKEKKRKTHLLHSGVLNNDSTRSKLSPLDHTHYIA